jgi:hypothetical protein
MYHYRFYGNNRHFIVELLTGQRLNGKDVPVHAMKAYGGMGCEGVTILILNLGTRQRCTAMPLAALAPGKELVPIE